MIERQEREEAELMMLCEKEIIIKAEGGDWILNMLTGHKEVRDDTLSDQHSLLLTTLIPNIKYQEVTNNHTTVQHSTVTTPSYCRMSGKSDLSSLTGVGKE